jgi:hypothetical protein
MLYLWDEPLAADVCVRPRAPYGKRRGGFRRRATSGGNVRAGEFPKAVNAGNVESSRHALAYCRFVTFTRRT